MASIKKFGWWLLSQFIPVSAAMAIGYHFGFAQGNTLGRLEMKCAILGVVERLSDLPAPHSVVNDCPKRKA